MKSKKIFIVTLLALMLVTLFVLGVFVACYPTGNVETQDQPETVVDADMEIVPTEEKGISIKGEDIPRKLFAQYGIAPIAQTAKTLTATITPSDAENKVVDWSVAWKNPSSTWANGKTVTQYVTVTPTSDGALTANVACLKGFGEKVIVKVAVRDADGIEAACTCDYQRRALGFDVSFTHSNTKTKKVLDLKYATSTYTIDFPWQETSANNFLQDYSLRYCFTANGVGDYIDVGYKLNLSEDYTLDAVMVSGFAVSFAPTADLIAAFTAASVPTTGMTAGTYSKSMSATTSKIDLTDLMYFGSDRFSGLSDANAFARYCNLRAALKQRADKVMLLVKCTTGTNDGQNVENIYSIKFTASSLTALATGITVSDTAFTF